MNAKRSPQNVRPARIAPLANLPLFHRVAGETVLVAGGGPGAVWKAELLAAAGASVRVLAGDAEGAEAFAALAAHPPAGRLEIFPRPWAEADLDGVKLAFADVGEDEVDSFVQAAKARSIPVNVVDRTEYCDFQVGTIVNRSPVVIAISTDGAAPMLGQSIRTRIEATLPLGLSAWAKAAAAWRPRLKARLPVFADRRRFWERFTRRAWEKIDQTPTTADFQALLDPKQTDSQAGQVILVGAGPGDPELLTLKAVRALQSATTILFDDLVSPEILELARREAVRIAVGKTGHGPSCSQSEICERIVDLAKAGENVVRLKGGDPLVFGRATEEIDACRAAGIEVSIIPGISAAQGAAAALGISLTERLNARRVQFITGHGSDGRLPRDLDWDSITDPVATTALYMPRRTLAEFVEQALARGLRADLPTVAVASATLPNQAHVAGPLHALPAQAALLPGGVPVVVIIGEVARDLIRESHSIHVASAA